MVSVRPFRADQAGPRFRTILPAIPLKAIADRCAAGFTVRPAMIPRLAGIAETVCVGHNQRRSSLSPMPGTDITTAPPLDSAAETNGSGYRLGRASRALLALWTLFLLAGFALAASLEPDPRGYGTHQRLGLPPCTFQILFSLKCPSCGSTTSFAHFIRGEWLASIRANPAAFGLAVMSAAMVPWGILSTWLGRTWRVERPATVFVWLLSGVVTLSLLQWVVRIAIE